jgi:hypothetical protein
LLSSRFVRRRLRLFPWKQNRWRQLQLRPLHRHQLFRSPLLFRLLSQQRFLLRQVRLQQNRSRDRLFLRRSHMLPLRL